MARADDQYRTAYRMAHAGRADKANAAALAGIANAIARVTLQAAEDGYLLGVRDGLSKALRLALATKRTPKELREKLNAASQDVQDEIGAKERR